MGLTLNVGAGVLDRADPRVLEGPLHREVLWHQEEREDRRALHRQGGQGRGDPREGIQGERWRRVGSVALCRVSGSQY